MGEAGGPRLEGARVFWGHRSQVSTRNFALWELHPVNPSTWRKSKSLFLEMFYQVF